MIASRSRVQSNDIADVRTLGDSGDGNFTNEIDMVSTYNEVVQW